jgi:hypothetical protein
MVWDWVFSSETGMFLWKYGTKFLSVSQSLPRCWCLLFLIPVPTCFLYFLLCYVQHVFLRGFLCCLLTMLFLMLLIIMSSLSSFVGSTPRRNSSLAVEAEPEPSSAKRRCSLVKRCNQGCRWWMGELTGWASEVLGGSSHKYIYI